MASIASAVLDNECLLGPACGIRTNVYSYAKHDRQKGEELDGIGGYNCYGNIDNSGPSWQEGGLPIALSDGLPLKRDLRKDEPIVLSDVVYDPASLPFRLYAQAHEAAAALAQQS